MKYQEMNWGKCKNKNCKFTLFTRGTILDNEKQRTITLFLNQKKQASVVHNWFVFVRSTSFCCKTVIGYCWLLSVSFNFQLRKMLCCDYYYHQLMTHMYMQHHQVIYLKLCRCIFVFIKFILFISAWSSDFQLSFVMFGSYLCDFDIVSYCLFCKWEDILHEKEGTTKEGCCFDRHKKETRHNRFIWL